MTRVTTVQSTLEVMDEGRLSAKSRALGPKISALSEANRGGHYTNVHSHSVGVIVIGA